MVSVCLSGDVPGIIDGTFGEVVCPELIGDTMPVSDVAQLVKVMMIITLRTTKDLFTFNSN